jgi:hypothetical protein
VEILRLRAGRHALLPREYFDYRLFEPGMPWAAKKEYLGSWAKDRVYRIHEPEAYAIGRDKLRTYGLLAAHGLRFPAVLAVAHADEVFPGAVQLVDASAATAWLGSAPYPLFAKPSSSYSGYGGWRIDGCDHGVLRFGNGETAPIEAFASACFRPGRGAMLFQVLARPHPVLAARIGDRVATARVMVLNDGTPPEIFRAALRIPVGRSMTDNFRGGRSGNLMAQIDIDSGRVKAVRSAIGLDFAEAHRHPDTGELLDDLAVPDWSEARALVIAASRAMPGLKVHSWDVAFTDAGPSLLETNPRGDFPLLQHAAGRGLAEPRFLRLYPEGRI